MEWRKILVACPVAGLLLVVAGCELPMTRTAWMPGSGFNSMPPQDEPPVNTMDVGQYEAKSKDQEIAETTARTGGEEK